jgi:hypothetical protein
VQSRPQFIASAIVVSATVGCTSVNNLFNHFSLFLQGHCNLAAIIRMFPNLSARSVQRLESTICGLDNDGHLICLHVVPESLNTEDEGVHYTYFVISPPEIQDTESRHQKQDRHFLLVVCFYGSQYKGHHTPGNMAYKQLVSSNFASANGYLKLTMVQLQAGALYKTRVCHFLNFFRGGSRNEKWGVLAGMQLPRPLLLSHAHIDYRCLAPEYMYQLEGMW